jgi:hypothetical protein
MYVDDDNISSFSANILHKDMRKPLSHSTHIKKYIIKWIREDEMSLILIKVLLVYTPETIILSS